MTLSDAFRSMLTGVALEKALPFKSLIPNGKTIQAMKDAREVSR
ncbi:MAG: type II toxin-antitoxin system RelB/DinJ family antitoxin [Gallionellaceae bacterium]